MTYLSWVSIFRLGAVQMCLGAIVVICTSTLNRVMVVEGSLPAILPGLLVGTASPEQRRQLLAASGLVRIHCEVCEQSSCLARRKTYRGRGIVRRGQRESAREAHTKTSRTLHSWTPITCGRPSFLFLGPSVPERHPSGPLGRLKYGMRP